MTANTKSEQHLQIELHGTTVHYWVYNAHKSPTIVMLHGFRGTHLGMGDIIEHLPDARLVVPDLPGFGRSRPMTDLPHNIEGYAQLAYEFIAATQTLPVVLFGHSMGTQIAAELVAQHPDVATHLLLVNPIAEPPLEGSGRIKMAPGNLYHWLGGKALPERAGHALLTNKFLFLVGSATMTKTKDKALRSKIHNNHINYMGDFSDRRTLLEAYVGSTTSTVTDRAEHIHIPTLLIAGKIDAIAPIGGQRKLVKALKHGHLVELDNVGHIIHYEKPAEAATEITRFLNEASPSA